MICNDEPKKIDNPSEDPWTSFMDWAGKMARLRDENAKLQKRLDYINDIANDIESNNAFGMKVRRFMQRCERSDR